MILIDVDNFLDKKDNKKNEKSGYSEIDLLNEFENQDKPIALVLAGQVQSGKTEYIREIIDKAINEFNYNYIFYISGINRKLKDQTDNRLNHKFDYEIRDIDLPTGNGVYSVLKGKQLEKMFDLIDEVTNKETKILIIDDESDYGSINTKKDGETKVYKDIKKSYEKIYKGGIIFVSATPYANILNKKSKFDIKKIYTLPISNEYTGLDYFNQLNNFYIIDDNIEEKREYLEYSIIVWFIQSYLYFKEFKNEKSELLIYISDENDEQDWINTHVFDIIARMKDNIMEDNIAFFVDKIEMIKNKLNLECDVDNDSLFKFIKSIISNYSATSKPSNEELINFYINKLNSESKGLEGIGKDNIPQMMITIGGVFLSRGVTYENLLTELFLYCPNNNVSFDTLLQRCRWFGYRLNKSKYMNVITKASIKQNIDACVEYNKLICQNKNGGVIEYADFYSKLQELETKWSNKGSSTSNVKRK